MTQKRRQVKVTMRITWQLNASTWKVGTIAVRERLWTPKREASPIIRDVAQWQPRRPKNPRKGKQTDKGQAKTEEPKGWGDTGSAVCQYWPKGKEEETPTEAVSPFRWHNESQEKPVVNAWIFQISSIWNISTNFNECRCRPRFIPGQADMMSYPPNSCYLGGFCYFALKRSSGKGSSIDTDAGMAAGVVMASGLIRGKSEDSEQDVQGWWFTERKCKGFLTAALMPSRNDIRW